MKTQDVLIVIDCQNDFFTGSLKVQDAVEIIPAIAEKVEAYKRESKKIIFTRDTHHAENYASTLEGRHIASSHCIEGSSGWQLIDEIRKTAEEYEKSVVINKTDSFGSNKVLEEIKGLKTAEVCGVCTDICVITEVLLIRANLPEMKVRVDEKCCAGLTGEGHKAALLVMKSCLVD